MQIFSFLQRFILWHNSDRYFEISCHFKYFDLFELLNSNMRFRKIEAEMPYILYWSEELNAKTIRPRNKHISNKNFYRP